MLTDGRKAEIRSAASAYRVNRVLLGTGSRLAIDHPGRRGGVLNRSGTVRVFRQVPQGNKSIIFIN
jgi:hypothetical protein